MKKIIFFIYIIINSICIEGQIRAQQSEPPHTIYRLLQDYKEKGTAFKQVRPFSVSAVNENIPVLKTQTILEYDKNTFQELYREKPVCISIDVPYNGQVLQLDLAKRKVHANNFMTISSGQDGDTYEQFSQEDLGIYYCGYVRGSEASSIASVSFYKDHVYCMISSENVYNLVIHPLKRDHSSTHVAYTGNELTEFRSQAMCATTYETQNTNKQTEKNDAPQSAIATIAGDKCVNVYLEVMDSIYYESGNDINNTREFVSSLFAHCASLYLNESVVVKISAIKIWTRSSPFNGNTKQTKLDLFRLNYRTTSYPGDMGVLLSLYNEGGIADGTNPANASFCSGKPNRLCIASLNYSDLPYTPSGGPYNFGLAIYVNGIGNIAHEIGHILGSKHTHDCAWRGSGSAIDGCVPNPGCPAPLPPPGGGTIMSYCHNVSGVGINFRNGFGLLPGELIRGVVAAANCLGSCETCPYSATFYNRTSGVNHAGIYTVANFINSEAGYNLTAGNNLVYDAGSYINLAPGFLVAVTSGTLFNAKIEGCEQDDPPVTSAFKSTAIPKPDADPIANIELYPNPASENINIAFTLYEAANATLVIINVVGQTVLETRVSDLAPGRNVKTIAVNTLLPGMYQISIKTPDLLKQFKFIKQ